MALQGPVKTTYVKSVARYLGWPLVILDPSDFAREGMHLITSFTAKIFDLLLELEDTVIFFDEMEELIRTREGIEAGSFEQRFLTTSLLPKLQYLNDSASCIFFVATNHFDTIDKAARREGRFDFQIQIVPPSFKEKERMLTGKWTSEVVPKSILKELKKVEEKITWATRAEMLTLIDNLENSPVDEARYILKSFSPMFLSDENRAKYMDESKYNVFHQIK